MHFEYFFTHKDIPQKPMTWNIIFQVTGESVSLWYRITDCPETPGTFLEWSSASRELNQALCCRNGQYVNCYGTECDCYRSDEGNL